MRSYISRSIGFTTGIAALLICMGVMAPKPVAAETAAAVHMPGFEDLAERLLPTVVNVATTSKVPSPAQGELPAMPELPPGSPFEQFFKDFYDQYQNNKLPQEEQKVSSLGSGFIIDAANGYIVTNYHVIKDADDIKVTLNDNTTLDAKLVGEDDKTDIAVLKIKPPKPLTAAVWGDSEKSRIGSWIMAIGDPFGLGGTVTAGIVSARQRDINAGPYDQFIQTDAPINRGNSGGPMYNMNGEVIGINTAIFSPSGGSVGIGFAIPSNLAKGVVAQLIQYGKTKRGWLGVKIQAVTPEIAESIGLDHAHGAMVSSVTPGGPADKAGIRSGDVILKFNDHDIKEMRELPLMVAESEVGKQASVTLWRKGKEQTVTVDLGQLEKAEESMAAEKKGKGGEPAREKAKVTVVESLGLGLSYLTDEGRNTYKIPRSIKGVLVAQVKQDSDAADKDLAVGDVIAEIDQQEVVTPEEAAQKVEAAQKAGHASVLLFVSRGDDMRFVALKFKKVN
jgi:serine protease Do